MTNTGTEHETRRRGGCGLHVAAVLAIVLLILLLHGRSLGYGWFMDDYAHQQQLRESDWSLRGLTEACRLELNGGIIDLWWLPECTLRFFRPLSFAWMKLLYELSGWSALAQHVACLGWHALASALVATLLMRLSVSTGVAWSVAALFAIHPGHVATVEWIAAQTELMVTVLTLLALLAYVRLRGWERNNGTATGWGWALLVLAAFALALGCRENAVMLPFVLLGVEAGLAWVSRRDPQRASANGASPVKRPAALVVLWVGLPIVLGGYLLLRSHLLGGASLPPRPYVVSPAEPDFARFVLDKAGYYLLGEFLLAPIVPIGGLAYLRERPMLLYGASALLLALLLVGWWRARRRALGWLAPACLLGYMAPVLPAFESPHHLYLPGVGWAMFAGLLLDELRGAAASGHVLRLRRGAADLITVSSLAVFALLTYFFSRAFDTAQQVEDRVVAEVIEAEPSLRSGDTLYFANLPMIAHYVRLAVEQRSGVHGLRVAALTWSPQLLGLSGAMQLDRRDATTLELRITDERYFAGPAQRLIYEAGRGRRLEAGGAIETPDFRVEVLESDERGVGALRFRFQRPFDGAAGRLYWGSRVRWAQPLDP